MSTPQQTAKVIIGIVESCESSRCCDLCTNEIVSQINSLLSPVRECLEGLRRSGSCWCETMNDGLSDFTAYGKHDDACLAAQQLYERLKTQ